MTPDEKRAYDAARKRRKYQTDPEFREADKKNAAAYTKERMATDPEFRERKKAANRASAQRRAEDPDRREKMLEASRESRRKFLAANPNYDRDRRARLKAERTNP